jgi:hypothetical protein
MNLPDTNTILRTYLLTQDDLTALVGQRIYCPRAPENATLPNITFFTRGGRSTPYIPDLPSPSVQIDCWADDPIEARELYRTLYDALQGIQNVTVGSNVILSAIEEVQGQDLVDTDIPGRFRVLSFWEIMIR